MPKKERGLGRGLDALLSGTLEGDYETVRELPAEKIHPRKDQPRKKFDEDTMQELASSIREHGILQPVLVRPVENGYEIIAGERRWRAAQLAGLTHVPVVVRDIDDRQAAEISLIENIQRDDLTVVEEAKAYRMLAEQFGYTQETIAEKIGKSRAYVANTLRILNLPEEILQMLERGELSAGHVRPLLALPTAEEQLAAAKEIVANKMTVRQVENKVKTKRIKFDIPADKPVELVEIQEKLQQHFATRAVVTKHGKGGKIEIAFYSDEDLERILEMMGILE
ncbi:MAG TPA: ParB/RepB/Spo0J family partition protein [Syntrophomonadaceae bacterium]|nr:ParB/RepB/Spo0J family partition protein [Syntrophomonadaceae bacterium]HPU48682.1 ParB/RepB/Spo0J family partition protein [Syntrophomonadaceae bacterium]